MVELSRAFENQGNLSDAIKVMKEYTELNPEDLIGFKRLADLYQLNHQYNEYYQTLQLIQNKSTKIDKDAWQELASWYGENNLVEKQEEILNELILEKKADGEDYMNLAALYVQNKEYDKVIPLLKTVKEYFPKLVDINFYLLQVLVTNQGEKNQESIQALADYLIKKNERAEIIYALSFINKDLPSLTSSLLKALAPIIEKDPKLNSMALQIMWQDKAKQDEVYPKLLELISKGTQDVGLQNLAFEILLEKKQDKQLIDLIRHIFVKNIDNRNVVNLSLTSLLEGKPYLAKEMETGLGKDYLNSHPFTAIALDIGSNQKNAEEKLLNYITTTNLTQTEYYNLFRLATAAKFEKEALTMGEKLTPYDGLEEYQLIEIAQGYLQLKKPEMLKKMVETNEGKEKFAIIALLLDIAAHQSKKVGIELQELKNVTKESLSALYTTAEEYKEYPLALYIAKRKRAEYPSQDADADYALALVQLGKIPTGLEMLSRLNRESPNSPRFEKIYFTALTLASKQNPYYHDELLNFIKQKEKQGALPVDLQRDFIYAYLDIFHDFNKGRKLLKDLIKKQNFSNMDDLNTLVYLIGPNPSAKDIAWIEAKAKDSQGENRSLWMQNLMFIGKFKEAADLYESAIDENPSPKTQFIYMEALAFQKEKQRLRCAIDTFLDHFAATLDRKQIDRVSVFTEEASYVEARRWIWELAVSKWDNDSIAWQKLATAAFDMRDYTRTEEALNVFFNLYADETIPNVDLYESLYEYGVVLDKKREFEKAKEYYKLALCEVDRADKPTIRMKEIAALSYYKLRDPKRALHKMKEIFVLTSRDPDIGASYTNMLMDEGFLHDTSKTIRSLIKNRIGNFAFVEDCCQND